MTRLNRCKTAPAQAGALDQHPVPAAGTPEEASARRWLLVQGGAVKRMNGLVVGAERQDGVPTGCDLDAGRLSSLLASLPAVKIIKWLVLRADSHRRPTEAAIQAFLAGAARAIAGCSGLQTLQLNIVLADELADQVPEALVHELASVRTLEEVSLRFDAGEADMPDWPAPFSLAHLVAGVTGLPRLRALRLSVDNVSMEATLPAGVSCLARLTSLTLGGFDDLRCEPGWARLSLLVRLVFEDCVFAHDGEDALPGLHALASLTSFGLWNCPSLRVLPASLWRLPQLRDLAHWGELRQLAGVPRSALPVAGLPLSAPCFGSMLSLTLTGHNLRAFPPGILGMKCLKHLNLSRCCFERLPEGVSVLTGLEELRLGRHPMGELEIGGAFDARVLGSLAGFPRLNSLGFKSCSVEFATSIQDAADHPRLQRLQLCTAYPAVGPSSRAFLALVGRLLEQGRARALRLCNDAIQGAGQPDGDNFLAALQVVGFPLHDGDSDDDDIESVDDDDFSVMLGGGLG
jgi:hypothetical protein